MNNTLLRLKANLSFKEKEVVRVLCKEIEDKDIAQINVSTIAEKANVVTSTATQTMRILNIAGVIESCSLGCSGTYVKVINNDLVKSMLEI